MLKIIDGDIFESDADMIVHQVNCQGVMGSGIAKQVREKFPEIYKAYKEECTKAKAFGESLLGTNSYYNIDDNGRCIACLFAQKDYGWDKKCYTNYAALRKCLHELKYDAWTLSNHYSRPFKIAIPYLMGCCRGGGNWNIVSEMIEEELFDDSGDIEVTLYRYLERSDYKKND